MRNVVQKHTATFLYNKEQIRFNFWTQKDTVTPDTIIFLGTAQVGKIPKWVAEAVPVGVVVVDGLPHWKAHPSGQDLKEFTINYTRTAFKAVFDTFNITSANIIASSQAVPGVIWVARESLNKVRNIGLISPLGFTSEVFGESMEARIKKLKLRALKSLFQYSQSFLHDQRNIYIHFILLRAILQETEWGASDRKYAAGLAYNLIEDTRIIVEKLESRGNYLTIILGEKDKVFPPHEVLASLKAANLEKVRTVISPNLSHSSLAVRANRNALVEIISMLRKNKKS